MAELAQTGAGQGRYETPDYDLADVITTTTPDQLKAVGDGTRSKLLSLLLERAATTSQLAAALGKPKGTVAYHLGVLEDAGLVRVVRTRKVRALTEKYYGRTARTFVLHGLPDEDDPFFMLNEAMAECRMDPADPLPMFTIRHARIPRERAVEFIDRVVALAADFAGQHRSGDTVYGFLAGVYPTTRPTLEGGAE